MNRAQLRVGIRLYIRSHRATSAKFCKSVWVFNCKYFNVAAYCGSGISSISGYAAWSVNFNAHKIKGEHRNVPLHSHVHTPMLSQTIKNLFIQFSPHDRVCMHSILCVYYVEAYWNKHGTKCAMEWTKWDLIWCLFCIYLNHVCVPLSSALRKENLLSTGISWI